MQTYLGSTLTVAKSWKRLRNQDKYFRVVPLVDNTCTNDNFDPSKAAASCPVQPGLIANLIDPLSNPFWCQSGSLFWKWFDASISGWFDSITLGCVYWPKILYSDLFTTLPQPVQADEQIRYFYMLILLPYVCSACCIPLEISKLPCRRTYVR